MKKIEANRAQTDAFFRAIQKEEVAVVDGKLVRVRHWKIEKELGEGATANVYLGISLLNESEYVAIKVFKDEYFEDEKLNDANQKMMRTEAALVGKISHPNILQTYSVGLSSASKYLVMEFIRGGSLDDYIDPPNNLKLSHLTKLFFQCGAAFEYSYEIGVIHRDIKPANILMINNEPKITDYGSSMVKGMDKDSVRGVGSPSYMSSEQIRQEPLNEQTDIYSLGATFFEMITGVRTFTAESSKDMIYKILYIEPPPISKFISSRLPSGLEDIVSKCLKKKQEERYQTWSAFLHDMVLMIYAITPKSKRYMQIDEVAAFDFVRGCKTMAAFEDSELWDLIGSGIITQSACGMAFSIKPEEVENEGSDKVHFKELSKTTLNTLTMETDEDLRRPKKQSKIQMTYSFVLTGAIQSYGNGTDNRIQILQSGDFCSNMYWIENYKADTKAEAYALSDTVMISITERQITNIHPVVRDKLNQLIRVSQEKQAQTVRHRHTKIDIHQAVKEASLGMHLI